MNENLKAYEVRDVSDSEGYCALVFAENANEAKKRCYCVDPFEDCEYINLRAKREPVADKYVNIRSKADRLEWLIPEHQKILKELGWFEIKN